MSLPIHLSEAAIEDFGRALNAIRDEVMASRGERDRRYLLRVIGVQRSLEIGGRIVMLASLALLPRWGHALASWATFVSVLALGTLLLALAKILENMEIGHNVMHGQWNWLGDPRIQSATWEWDSVCPSHQWKHSHNLVHHRWTNVLGKDRDVGYGILRVTKQQPWHPVHLGQPLYNVLLALFFEWGVALHDLEVNRLASHKKPLAQVLPMLQRIGRKVRRQVLKDYILWPLLAGPFFLYVCAANAVANIIRNVWAYMIIFCGHFPAGVHYFYPQDIDGEARAHWYVRQLLGTCNIDGGRLFHILSGNLGHQIEHHFFPDMPSNRYREIAPRVRALCGQYGLPYNSRSLARQFGSTTMTILKLSLPSRTAASLNP